MHSVPPQHSAAGNIPLAPLTRATTAAEAALDVVFCAMPRPGIYFYLDGAFDELLINRAWWRGLDRAQRVAMLAPLRGTGQPVGLQIQGWGRPVPGQPSLMQRLAALPPAWWEALLTAEVPLAA